VLRIRVKKTGKELEVTLNRAAKEAIEFYLGKIAPKMIWKLGLKEETLQASHNRYLFDGRIDGRPLTYQAVSKRIKNLCRSVGLTTESFGVGTLRKTWGYQARKLGIPIEIITEKLGHATQRQTKLYLGITRDEVAEVEKKVVL